MQFSSDLDAETKKRIEKGQMLSEVLTQGRGAPLSFERQVVIIYSAVNGYMDSVPVSKIRETESKLFDYIERESSLLSDIYSSKELTDDIEEKLKSVLETFFSKHI